MTIGQHRRTQAVATGTSPLLDLGRDLDRHRTRAGRAWRRYQATDEMLDPVTATTAHRAWSDAIDDALSTAETISRGHPRSLGELLIQYEAIWWWMGADDNVLDGSTRRWLVRFRRSLRRFAVKN